MLALKKFIPCNAAALCIKTHTALFVERIPLLESKSKPTGVGSWQIAYPAGPREQTVEPQITQKKVCRWPAPGSAIRFHAGEDLLGTG